MGGSSGRLVLAAGGQNRAIFLAPTAVDWDVQTDVSLDKAPVGGGSAWVYHEVRRSEHQHERLPPGRRASPANGSDFLSASRVVNGAETQIGSCGRRADGQLPSRASRCAARSRARTRRRSGSRPGSEPSPTRGSTTATDSLGPQVAGRGGLRAYASSSTSNVPLTYPARQLLGQRDGSPAASASAPAAAAAAPSAAAAASASAASAAAAAASAASASAAAAAAASSASPASPAAATSPDADG